MKKDHSVDKASTRRLRAAGCPIPADHDSEPERDLIIEVAQPETTIAYDVPGGGVELVFGLRITNQSYVPLMVEGFRASLPWSRPVLWRGDPSVSSPETTAYRLGNGRELPCTKILNYRTGEAGMLEPGGGCLEGFLLGYILFDRIPTAYIHGSNAPADLCVVDHFGRPHWAEIEMLIDRAATMPPARPAGSKSTLFDGDVLEPLPWQKHGWGPNNPDPHQEPRERDEAAVAEPLSNINVNGT
ncbi:MAG TPA: hypothetical protein VE866_04545 [Candidatus Binatia bacterium]|nr:hypothetical protein [Candidatus Binatia bacterium]